MPLTKDQVLKDCRQRNISSYGATDEAMDNWAAIQTAERDARILELEAALSELVHLHLCEQEGLSSGQPTAAQWYEAVNKASELLNTRKG